MPKNKGKGGKNRRRGKNDSEEKRELARKLEGQEYGQVLRMLGNCRTEVHCFDGIKRLCHIRGKMRKRVWVNTGDFVLVSLRDFQNAKGDIIVKYTPDECRALKTQKEFPESITLKEADGPQFDDDNRNDVDIDFVEGIDISAI